MGTPLLVPVPKNNMKWWTAQSLKLAGKSETSCRYKLK
jgi:hypothetical protein